MADVPTRIKLLRLGARADTWDFRDAVYRPNLVEVPDVQPLSRIHDLQVPVLHQGPSMKCTGYALATAANTLLRMREARVREGSSAGPVTSDVSPEMLYAMARRYDEYPGSRHQGSSVRGAVKGWHHHGVCSRAVWEKEEVDGVNYGPTGVLTRGRAREAAERPLGAYFRVDPTDLNAVHCALTEVGVLIAALRTHDGWFDLLTGPARGEDMDPVLALLLQAAEGLPGKPPLGPAGASHRGIDPEKGLVRWPAPDSLRAGLHAVAVVGYDRDGVWIQNSLGTGWGAGGFGRLTWDDWVDNASDAWVARLGAPVSMSGRARPRGTRHAAAQGFTEMRPHVIPVDVAGQLQEYGPYATGMADVRSILRDELRVTSEAWRRRRLLVVASSGLGGFDETVADLGRVRDTLLGNEIYPLLFAWNMGFEERLHAVAERAYADRVGGERSGVRRRGVDARVDGSLETLVRRWGWADWDQLKRLAGRTAEKGGALAVVLDQLDRAVKDAVLDHWSFDIHIAGESTAAWALGHLVRRLTTPRDEGGYGRIVKSCTLVAPACTTRFFHETFGPALDSGRLERLTLVTLADALDRVDTFGPYRASLLYLISNALEHAPRVPPEEVGSPMLGLTRHVLEDPELSARFARKKASITRADHVILGRDATADIEDGAPVHGRLLLGTTAVRKILERNIGVRAKRKR